MSLHIARIQKGKKNLFSNAGWKYDAYPELETLDKHSTMLVAEFQGPGIVNHIHMTQHWVRIPYDRPNEFTEEEAKAIAARGIILEVYYDGVEQPSVRVPLGDFFCDGCGGRANFFSNLFFEKAPDTYNCFIPMPFKESIRILLRNETDMDFMNYTFVEGETLDAWDDGLGYFHATWDRFGFQLSPDTDQHFLHVEGAGHLLGRSYSIATDDPKFMDYYFVMEGNNEIRVDGEDRPSIDYLGTEDAFGFSWGFRFAFNGLRNGMNFVSHSRDHKRIAYRQDPCMVSIYRFHDTNPIRFEKSLDLHINWTKENHFTHEFEAFRQLAREGRLWIDYAATHYWYQDAIGFAHPPLLPLADRVRPVLRSNRKS